VLPEAGLTPEGGGRVLACDEQGAADLFESAAVASRICLLDAFERATSAFDFGLGV
jgi:hypothetical protein